MHCLLMRDTHQAQSTRTDSHALHFPRPLTLSISLFYVLVRSKIQVHVVEARDLKPQDAGGTSDPFVVASCSLGGSPKRTKPIKKNNSPLFEERFVFNFKDLSRQVTVLHQAEELLRMCAALSCSLLARFSLTFAPLSPRVPPQALQEATLTLSVYDADWWGLSKQMIGSHSFDLLRIYTRNEQHELYRAWVALTDTEEDNDEAPILPPQPPSPPSPPSYPSHPPPASTQFQGHSHRPEQLLW